VPVPAEPPLPVDAARLRHDADPVLVALGRPGSRALLPTPALVCDVDVLEANLATMAARVAAAGVALRPHAKTHKSAFVARRQLAHGAVGISCASVSEAEALVGRLPTGVGDPHVSLLVTSPVVGPVAARAADLATRCALLVATDHPDGVDELAAAVGHDRTGSGTTVGVVCDVDVGLGRTGVTGPDQAVALVRRIAAHPGLRFAGVQGYAGHAQHLADRASRAAAAHEGNRRLRAVVDALEGDGHTVGLRTGGGTGTSGPDLELGVLDELQAGSYVFMDREYRDALAGDPDGAFGQSLVVTTTVVSDNQSGFVTVDAGLKAMATDAGAPTVVDAAGDVAYHFFGDEHGLVTRGADDRFRRGDRLDLVPPHCDPTVDRYDVLWLVRGDTVVGVADIDARGCSQ
jgi:D-serine deaminase-like pyridoxal phosphate-dependent protein